jgi:sensor histidine kinase regulating citrate/malate metabolism
MLRGVRSWIRWRVVTLAAVALLLAMTQVWMRNRVRAEAYELSKVRQLQNALLHREREARIQLETERDSTVLRARATERLGMIEPRSGQVVDVVVGIGAVRP